MSGVDNFITISFILFDNFPFYLTKIMKEVWIASFLHVYCIQPTAVSILSVKLQDHLQGSYGEFDNIMTRKVYNCFTSIAIPIVYLSKNVGLTFPKSYLLTLY